MNFLAHMYLSCSDEDLLMGNFIADYIRNRDLVLYTEEIVKGIKLHRHIDHFTDTHPQVIKSTRVLREHHGKYAPVVIDVCYDYILSKNWERYAGESLREFADRVYHVIDKNNSILPDHLQVVAPKMIANDFLLKYGTESGLRKTFDRISKRAKYPSNWSQAYDDMLLNYEELENGFNIFFPDIIDSIDQYCNC